MHVPASRLRPAGEPAGVSRITDMARKAPLIAVASVALTF
jgi:hypothetical protein